MSRRRIALLAAAALALGLPVAAHADLAGCASQGVPGGALCAAVAAGQTVQQAEAPLVGPRDSARRAQDTALEAARLCDPRDHAACLLPFPNDRFTVADPSTPTGRRVNISPLATPQNVEGKPIDPTELNRNDGWSPGQPILTSVPGLDLGKTGAAGTTDVGASLRDDAPIVLLDAATGQRHPYWAEMDSNPTDGEQPLLIVRPAVNFTDGHRYVIGLRDLRTSSGARIPAGTVFAGDQAAAQSQLDSRKAHGSTVARAKRWDDPVFGPLARAGVAPRDLFLAWTFTVASTRNTTGRMLHIRDDAFAPLGADGAPAFTVDKVQDGYSSRVSRRVTGRFSVPNYLNVPVNAKDPVLGADPALPGTRFNYLPGDDLPDRNGTFTATYTCDIPTSAVANFADPAASATPGRGSIYGHGLLGGQGEVGAGNVQKMGAENDIVFCATDWYGMATGDLAAVATMLHDMSNFPTLPDRVQQGMLAQLFLARLLKSTHGFASDAAFQKNGTPVVQTGAVYYDGNSQGGIIGGALMAVATDITRGALGVPGMNYSTLLDRSTDFSTYESVLNASYPSETDREILFGLVQPLWDRAEANGYAAHITHHPLPGTPSHAVLMHVAYGDHQVANVSAEVEARTIGAATNPGFLAPGRHWAVQPGWGIPRIGAFPYDGSVFEYWDSGTAAPPNGNVPAVNGPGLAGHDPHEDPRATYAARVQKNAFLQPHGLVVDVCGGGPCYARPLAPEDPPAGS